ncbi:MAG: efflux RND transporter permease subunit, partial [Gammaproteobacteria bacterium]|nr:efflux RND transporter permease subunit [Gammaproteobacteria bacterium]
PLSFFFAIVLFSFTGYGIQQVSIAGFIIALGLIVDNGIVVTENAFLLQNYQGCSRNAAAVEGTSSAISPLLSSTLTTMLAFTPVFFLTTDSGAYLRSMSVSIWLSLFASLFIALSFVTLLLARVGTIGPLFGIARLPSFLVWLIPFRDRAYKKLLFYVVKWRFVTVFAFLALLGYALYVSTQLKVEVFPATGDPYFTVNVNLPTDRDEAGRLQLADEIEQTLKRFDAVKSISAVIGKNFPLLNVGMKNIGDLVFLVETEYGDEPRLRSLLTEIKAALYPLKHRANMSVSMFKFEGGALFRSPFT